MIHHIEQGDHSAPAVTLIPGIGNDLGFWDLQAEALRPSFRLIRFDLPGHGQSPPAEGPCSFDLAMDEILRLWDRLRVDRSHVMGLGMGGAVAMNMAMAHPDRVLGLIGAGCRATMDDELRLAWRQRADLVEAQGVAALVDLTLQRWFPNGPPAADPDRLPWMKRMLEATSAAGYAGWSRAFAEVELMDRLDRITAPTLFITGEHDIFGGNPALVAQMTDRIPGARMQLIAGCGHLCNIEDPAAYNAAMLAFLGG